MDASIRERAALHNLEVDYCVGRLSHFYRYDFYIKDSDQLLGSYTHKEAVAFLDGYNTAQSIHKEENH